MLLCRPDVRLRIRQRIDVTGERPLLKTTTMTITITCTETMRVLLYAVLLHCTSAEQALKIYHSKAFDMPITFHNPVHDYAGLSIMLLLIYSVNFACTLFVYATRYRADATNVKLVLSAIATFWLIEFYTIYTAFFVEDGGWIRDLVEEGIEPNPGPEKYKNLNPVTLKFIAASKNRGNREDLVDRIRQRIRDKFIKSKRDEKWYPEAMNIGINDETKSFLKDIVAQLAQSFNSGLTVSFDFGIKRGIMDLMAAANEAGAFIYDTLRFFLAFVGEHVAEKFRPLFEFVYELLPSPNVSVHKTHPGDPYKPESGLGFLGYFTFWYFSGTIGKYVDENSFKKFVAGSKSFCSFSKSVTDTFSSILKCVKDIIEWICTYFDISLPSFLRTGNADLDDIYRRFKDLRETMRAGVEDDYNFAEKVYLLQLDIEGLVGKYSDDQSLKQRLDDIKRSFQPLVDYCERQSAGTNGTRPEPLGILFGGPTGAGKSTLTMPVLLAILSQVLPDELYEQFLANHNDFIFYRFSENVFMDGFKLKNKAIVYDDFGQVKDTAGNPNADAMEAIRWLNQAPYHLHFSAVEDKQKHYGRPLIVMATTNRISLDFQSVICPEAIVRRFKISYVQVPKMEYCVKTRESRGIWDPFSRRFDEEALRSAVPLDADNVDTYIVDSAMEYIPWDFAYGRRAEGKALSFKEVVDKCVKEVIASTKKGKNMLQYYKHIKVKYREMFKAESGLQESDFMSSDEDDEEFHDAIADVPYEVFKHKVKNLMYEAVETSTRYLLDIKGYVIKAAEWCKKYSKFLIALGCAVVTLIGVVGMCKLFSDMFTTKPESGEKSSNKLSVKTSVSSSTTRSYKDRQIIRPMPEVVPEGGDKQAFDWLRAIVKRNMYSIYLNGGKIGQVLFLKGTTFVCPHHFDIGIVNRFNVSDADEGEGPIVEFRPCGSDIVYIKLNWYDLKLVNVHSAEGVDLAVYKIDHKFCRSHSDISRHFATPSSLARGSRFKSYMPLFRSEGTIVNSLDVHIYDDVEYVSGGVRLKSRALTYEAPSEQGDCGTPLISADGRFGKPVILGIHTAGHDGLFRKRCAGVMLNSDVIAYLLDLIEETDPYVEDITVEDGEMQAHGFVPLHTSQQPRLASASNIMRSNLYGKLWPITQRPSYLLPFTNASGETIDPRLIAQQKYLHDEPYVPRILLDEIDPYIKRMILRNFSTKPWEPRLLTYKEAVAGIPGVAYCDGIARSKSAGYPHCLDPKIKGKTYWFGSEGDIDFDSDKAKEMEQRINSILEKTKKGVRHEFVFVDHLKDARVPIEKAQQGKARQFNACPVELLILTKMYFGDFVRHTCLNRIHNGVGIGMDVYTEWDTLAKHLQPSPGLYNFTAGDYSGYDTRIPVCVALYVLGVIENYYASTSTEQDRTVRRVLYMNFINSLHISEGVVYEHVGGNPSGQPLTPIYNSISNLFIIYGAANLTRWSIPGNTISVDRMFSASTVTVFGDDNVVGYQKELKSLFNQQCLGESIKLLFNMEYTNEMKSDDVVEERSLEEVSYLKRSFRKTPFGYVCPLELSVIKETLNWRRKTTTDQEFELVIESVLRELSIHGKTVYDLYAPKIIKLSAELQDYTPINSNYATAVASDRGLASIH